jgi:hypothetical protein
MHFNVILKAILSPDRLQGLKLAAEALCVQKKPPPRFVKLKASLYHLENDQFTIKQDRLGTTKWILNLNTAPPFFSFRLNSPVCHTPVRCKKTVSF